MEKYVMREKRHNQEMMGCIKYKAEELLKDNDFSELFDVESGVEIDETAPAALKVLLIEKAAEYATKSIKLIKQRRGNEKVGASAVLVSAQKDRW